jgi:hypothetical protein
MRLALLGPTGRHMLEISDRDISRNTGAVRHLRHVTLTVIRFVEGQLASGGTLCSGGVTSVNSPPALKFNRFETSVHDSVYARHPSLREQPAS